MTNLLTSILLACVFLAQAGKPSQATDVIVRLVYLDSGKPAEGQQIILYEGNPSLAATSRSKQITDRDGVARFRVSTPFPEKVWVDDNNGSIRNCAWEDQIPLHEILSEGVTIGKDNRFGSSCKGGQDTIAQLGAKPGEVVLFVRKVSNWDNIRHY
ncbi:hypothetical protein EDE15_1030 [Edaphobacter aggregans]|uniref:Carboxypeptidase family protein n=1 Tax=Edaphobacter aggregans TaxID=570835 RepID=A0A428MF69_9BACT|nr:hypothetical protein [Edaphobacter aggregans]RSL15540.1 hypothetical protein EDE15_1030 [Edaphobacter aggregans]